MVMVQPLRLTHVSTSLDDAIKNDDYFPIESPILGQMHATLWPFYLLYCCIERNAPIYFCFQLIRDNCKDVVLMVLVTIVRFGQFRWIGFSSTTNSNGMTWKRCILHTVFCTYSLSSALRVSWVGVADVIVLVTVCIQATMWILNID